MNHHHGECHWQSSFYLLREMSKLERWVIAWIRVNEIHWFIDFSQAEQTSECVQKKEKEKERVNKSILLFFSSRYLGDVCSLTVNETRTCTKKKKKTIDCTKRTRDFVCFFFSRRFLHCCWIGYLMNNRWIRRRRRKRRRKGWRTRAICFFDRNDDILFIYKITHFFSFFILGDLIGRPPAGVGPGSRTGCLNGRTMRINSQKT